MRVGVLRRVRFFQIGLYFQRSLLLPLLQYAHRVIAYTKASFWLKTCSRTLSREEMCGKKQHRMVMDMHYYFLGEDDTNCYGLKKVYWSTRRTQHWAGHGDPQAQLCRLGACA